ncbi:Wadjet anti-phage system protein JetD domain-containing protein [Arthrobacter celericrescens]|uniref:Wadjet anti-phage system protein JetD domain-containing protein n=1 Tax=Arthrobacter celericrescens TaxID=2320851 RepID=UPI000EA01890|nr:Wadjet anti-phage system protein JetD domain-containing protein [Arthrobacter celericrescens]
MKSIDTIVATIRKHLDDGWHTDVADNFSGQWPKRYTLGRPTSANAATMTRDLRAWSYSWYDWAGRMQLELVDEPRRIDGRSERLPAHVTIPDIDTAARVAGHPWPSRIQRARARLEYLRSSFPTATNPKVLRQAEALDDVDFHLACAAARWFAEHDPVEWKHLTPRQVPVEGLHGKWLNSHQPLVKALAMLEELVLEKRPTRINFTYLDPKHRRLGRRLHDSYTLTDCIDLPYRPAIVVIVENKDTAVLFPEYPAAVAVEGNGSTAPGVLPTISWITEADHIIYWGDMDARGYEIVNSLRAAIPKIRTILMDGDAYRAYEPYGTNTEQNGTSIKQRPPKLLNDLTSAERDVYENLTTPGWPLHLRVEQERIPLNVALAHMERTIRR